MKASERCMIRTTLVGKSISEVIDTFKESVHVACFEHTGFIITLIANETHDSKIRPQVMQKGTFFIPKEPVISLNLVEEPEGHIEEEVVLEEKKSIFDELTENEKYLEMYKEIYLTAVEEDVGEDYRYIVDDNLEDVQSKCYNKMYFCSKNVF